MQVGLNFFPDVGDGDCSPATYFANCLAITRLADELGYHHVRMVEHYFRPYGGYSPNPIVFLSAAAQVSRRLRLVTGAVLPAFNHPLKLAGEIGMLDGLSGGRAEIGFARAFLPHEFRRFGVSLDDSRGRFEEGIEAVRRLLEEDSSSLDGQFHRYPETTSLPRPTQSPRPPFWVAALSTEQSFVRAGEMGHGVMAIPLAGVRMRELLDLYRDAYRRAGHPGSPRVMLAFHMVCHPDPGAAADLARDPIDHYLGSIVEAASDWTTGETSVDYPGYDKIFEQMKQECFDTVVAKGGAWVGTPDEIVARAVDYFDDVGGFDVASLQVSFANLDIDVARRSVELFASDVKPRLPGPQLP